MSKKVEHRKDHKKHVFRIGFGYTWREITLTEAEYEALKNWFKEKEETK